MAKTCSIDGCGKDAERQGMCQMHFWRLKHHGDVHHKRPKLLCSIEGCDRPHKGHGLCMPHLRRKRKGLPMDLKPPILPKKRYVVVKRPEHPLAMANGRVAVHRMNLYEDTGAVRVPCFWCGAPLEWGVNLHVDHRNHDRHDNAPENLLPACNSCNAGRMFSNSGIRTPMYRIGASHG